MLMASRIVYVWRTAHATILIVLYLFVDRDAIAKKSNDAYRVDTKSQIRITFTHIYIHYEAFHLLNISMSMRA